MGHPPMQRERDPGHVGPFSEERHHVSNVLARFSVRMPLVGVAFGILAWISGPVTLAQTDDVQPVQADLESAARMLQVGQPREALRTLESVEAVEPGNPWLWFYKGRAYLKLGSSYSSLDSLDRAQDLLIAYGNPEPQLSEAIRHYRRQARSQVFGISYRIGLAYDSNVTFLGSGGAGFEIAGRGDGRFTSRLQLMYAPLADETETLTFAARLAHAWNFSIEDFNDQDYGATIRYDRRLNDRWEAALQYDYDITYLGNQPFYSYHGLAPGLNYRWRPSPARLRPTETRFLYRIESRDFLFETAPEFDRDGFVNVVSVEQQFAFQPMVERDWTWMLGAGYSFESVITEGTEFDRLVHNFYLALAVPLKNPWLPDKDLTLRFNASWQIADYREGSLIDADGDERSDLITALNAALSQRLFEDPDLGDLTLHAIVGWTDADSNVTTGDAGRPFSYDKWVAGVQLEWSW